MSLLPGGLARVTIKDPCLLFAARETVHSSNASNYGFQILIAFGAGAFTQAGFAVIQAVVDPKDAADGITLMLVGQSRNLRPSVVLVQFTDEAQAQLCGLAFGLSIGGALFINLSIQKLGQALPQLALDQRQSIVSGTSGSLLATLDPNSREMALDAIIFAWQKVYAHPSPSYRRPVPA